MSCKSSINPITNPNTVYSHTKIVTVCKIIILPAVLCDQCKGRTYIEGVWEQTAEYNAEAQERGRDRGWRNFIMANFIICTVRQILFGRLSQGVWDSSDHVARMVDMRNTYIVVAKSQKNKTTTKFCRLRVRTSGGLLWSLKWTLIFINAGNDLASFLCSYEPSQGKSSECNTMDCLGCLNSLHNTVNRMYSYISLQHVHFELCISHVI
jgi:hypothetical protein